MLSQIKSFNGSVSPLALKALAILFSESPVAEGKQLLAALAAGDPRLLSELRDAELTPLIYAQLLSRKQHQKLPPAFLREFQQDYASALMNSARQEQAALHLIHSLNQARVDFLLLKGADLRLRLYGDATVRPACDWDFLVPPDKVLKGSSILEGMGFSIQSICAEPRPGFRQLFRNELHFIPPPGLSLMVDLHWEIRGGDHFYRLPFPPMWQRAVSLKLQGIPVKVLAPEHALTHLCLHLFSEGRIIHIIDIALALHTWMVNWPFFLNEVKLFRCQAPVYLIFREMDHLFPSLIPRMVLKALSDYRPPRAERLVLHHTLGYLTRHFATLYHHSPLEWTFYLKSLLWPQTKYLEAVYGGSNRLRFFRQIFKTLFSSAPNWTPH